MKNSYQKHLEGAGRRAIIRLRRGRSKPIAFNGWMEWTDDVDESQIDISSATVVAESVIVHRTYLPPQKVDVQDHCD